MVLDEKSIKQLKVGRQEAIDKIETLKGKRSDVNDRIQVLTDTHNKQIRELTNSYGQNKRELEQTKKGLQEQMKELASQGAAIDNTIEEFDDPEDQVSEYDWKDIKDEWSEKTE